MSFCDYDDPEFFHSFYPVAKKLHQCCECTYPIHPGEKYGKHSGKWDGRIGTFYQHLDCEAACVWIRKYDGECICFGDLFKWVNDNLPLDRKQCGPFRAILARVKRRIWKESKAKGG